MRLQKCVAHATIEIELTENWGDDCTLGQVETQARRVATATVREILSGTRVSLIGMHVTITLTGAP